MPEERVVGRVVLVGAGPGDPELITLRGLRWLRRADVVIHDRLVSEELLDEAPAEALRIFAGKARGRHCLEQAAINALLVHHAGAGRLVIRLKGGDPFVFGRGGEEVLACRAAGIPVEVVPGVSAAVAAPGAAGVPVTHRGRASSFAVVTGHDESTGHAPAVDWESFRRIDTLVVLMGLQALSAIARRLIAAGRAPDTPAAVISQGTTRDQQVVTGTLADIAARARHLPSPATIVVGPVVALAQALHKGPRGLSWRPRFAPGLPSVTGARGRGRRGGTRGPGTKPHASAAPLGLGSIRARGVR